MITDSFPLNQSRYPNAFRQKINNPAAINAAGAEPVANHFLSALDLRTFNRLTPFLERIELTAGKHIYQTPDNLDFVYFPETAVISEYKILEDGRTGETAMIGAEGIVGLAAALAGEKNGNCWTQILISGKALKLGLIKLKHEIENDGAMITGLFNYLNSYIEQISRRAVCNNLHLIEERFCSWLMMIKLRCGSDSLPLTHEQIARLLGVQRPSLTQAAKSLRAKGVIDYRRGRLEIRSERKLRENSCGCF